MRTSLFWVKFARLAITVERDGIIYLITACFVVMSTSLMTKTMKKAMEDEIVNITTTMYDIDM